MTKKIVETKQDADRARLVVVLSIGTETWTEPRDPLEYAKNIVAYLREDADNNVFVESAELTVFSETSMKLA